MSETNIVVVNCACCRVEVIRHLDCRENLVDSNRPVARDIPIFDHVYDDVHSLTVRVIVNENDELIRNEDDKLYAS